MINKENFYLPTHHNYIIKNFIESTFTKELEWFIATVNSNRKKVKHYTFTRIQESYEKADLNKQRFLRFPPNVSFYFSSLVSIEEAGFLKSILKGREIELYGQILKISDVKVLQEPNFSNEMHIRFLSPIVVQKVSQNNKITPNPEEEDFCRLVSSSIKKKYERIYGTKSLDEFVIEPIKIYTKITNIYEGDKIEGWLGEFKISSSIELIKLAYNTGLGSFNTEGFGMFAVVK